MSDMLPAPFERGLLRRHSSGSHGGARASFATETVFTSGETTPRSRAGSHVSDPAETPKSQRLRKSSLQSALVQQKARNAERKSSFLAKRREAEVSPPRRRASRKPPSRDGRASASPSPPLLSRAAGSVRSVSSLLQQLASPSSKKLTRVLTDPAEDAAARDADEEGAAAAVLLRSRSERLLLAREILSPQQPDYFGDFSLASTALSSLGRLSWHSSSARPSFFRSSSSAITAAAGSNSSSSNANKKQLNKKPPLQRKPTAPSLRGGGPSLARKSQASTTLLLGLIVDRQARKRQIRAFLDEPRSSRAAYLFAVASWALIFLNVTALVFPAAAGKTCRQTWGWQTLADWLAGLIFTAELVLRGMAASHWRALAWDASFHVDFVSVLPSYVTLGQLLARGFHRLPADCGGRGLRIVGALRLLRLLKVARANQGFVVISRAIRRALPALFAALFFLTVTVCIFATLLFHVEYISAGDAGLDSAFYSIPHTLWFLVVTMTTVGYGDVTPATVAGKCLTSVAMLAGVLFIAMPLAVVGNNFCLAWEDKERIFFVRRLHEALWLRDLSTDDLLHATRTLAQGAELTFRDFYDILKTLNIKIPSGHLAVLWQTMDAEKTGVVDLDEFEWLVRSEDRTAAGSPHLSAPPRLPQAPAPAQASPLPSSATRRRLAPAKISEEADQGRAEEEEEEERKEEEAGGDAGRGIDGDTLARLLAQCAAVRDAQAQSRERLDALARLVADLDRQAVASDDDALEGDRARATPRIRSMSEA